MQRRLLPLVLILAAPLAAQLVAVASRPVSRVVELPGEIAPFERVELHARVAGYVEQVLVDRGSVVTKGQLLIEMTAPELKTRIAEAESKILVAESERLQAEAKLAALKSTADHLAKAAQTPGVIAGNELTQAQKDVEAAQAALRSREQIKAAAQVAVQGEREMEAYLRLTAPFDAVVTERLVHPGALAGPNAAEPLLVLEHISRLRLVVAVPEEYTGGITPGTAVSFQVPAYAERTWSAKVTRISHTLDPKTRTMPVELDVTNTDSALAPGMYPKVKWPVRGSRPELVVPVSSVVTTTERTFVIRSRDGKAEWVDVKKGATDAGLVAVTGNLQAGDKILRRATDETREGSVLK